MKKTVISFLMLFSLEALASPHATPEDLMNSMKGPVDRYQMVRIDSDERGGASVMVLDTANGNLWQWLSRPAGKNVDQVKAKLIYMGRVIPGTRMGEIIDKGAYSPQ